MKTTIVETSIGPLTVSIPPMDILELNSLVAKLKAMVKIENGEFIYPPVREEYEIFWAAILCSLRVVHRDFTEGDLNRLTGPEFDALVGALIVLTEPMRMVAVGKKPGKPN